MTALAEVQALRRQQVITNGAEPERPLGARPLQYVGGLPVIEGAAQGRFRAELWWGEARRKAAAGTLDNRTLMQAHMHTLLAEDDPERLRRRLIELAAWATDYADQLGPDRTAAAPPPVPAQR